MKELNVGDSIPDFEVVDHEGTSCSKEDILGNPQIIYFYPKDNTPGCTKQACAFSEKIDLLDDMGISLIGVSPDHVKSHKKFIEKYTLPYTLFSDSERIMAENFGALNEERKIIRSTFLIDEEGVVQWIEKPVKVSGHVDRVIDAIYQLRRENKPGFGTIKEQYGDFLTLSFGTDANIDHNSHEK